MIDQDEPDLVRRRRERFGALLAATDPAPPRLPFPASRIARAARRRAAVRRWAGAAIAVVVLAAVTVPPVRAWIAGAAQALWSVATGARAGPGAHPRPVPGAGTVAFAPGTGSFIVTVVYRQAAGTLTLETTAGDSAMASSAGSGTAELIVLPGELRIVNDARDGESFVVRVPASLPAVEVRVGDAAPRFLRPSAPGQRWVVDLGRAP